MEEIEAKFLDIDKENIIKKLISLDALEVFSNRSFFRSVYDYPDLRLSNEKTAWLRVRDEGDKVTMTYKQRFGVNENMLQDGGINEIEVEVSDFEQTKKILEAIGLKEKFYEEQIRTKYMVDEVEVCIDEWPLLKPYMELEGTSFEQLKKVANKLDLDWDTHVKTSTMQVYELNGINENDYSILTFDKQVKK